MEERLMLNMSSRIAHPKAVLVQGALQVGSERIPRNGFLYEEA